MSDAIITVENLGKRYSLRHLRDQRYVALRDVLVEKATGLFRRNGRRRDNKTTRQRDNETVGEHDNKTTGPQDDKTAGRSQSSSGPASDVVRSRLSSSPSSGVVRGQ